MHLFIDNVVTNAFSLVKTQCFSLFYCRIMKNKTEQQNGVQDLCRKLKLQLDGLNFTMNLESALPDEEQARRLLLMEQLKRQLAELSR